MFSWVLLSDRQVISIDILPILLVWSLIGSILKTLSNINFTELYFPFELDLNEIRFRVTRPKHIIGTPEQISSSKWLSESLKFPGYMFTVNYCQFHLSLVSTFCHLFLYITKDLKKYTLDPGLQAALIHFYWSTLHHKLVEKKFKCAKN